MQSAYTPAACQIVIDAGKEGKSADELCLELGVSRKTLYNWADAHPEFKEAFELSRDYCDAWWAKLLREGANRKRFNERIYEMHQRFNYRIRLPDKCSLKERAEAILAAHTNRDISGEIANTMLQSIKDVITIEQEGEVRPIIEALEALKLTTEKR